MKRPARKTAKRDPLRITKTDVGWLRDHLMYLNRTAELEALIEQAKASGDSELLKLRKSDLANREYEAGLVRWRLKQIREAQLIERAVRDALDAAKDQPQAEGGAS